MFKKKPSYEDLPTIAYHALLDEAGRRDIHSREIYNLMPLEELNKLTFKAIIKQNQEMNELMNFFNNQ